MHCSLLTWCTLFKWFTTHFQVFRCYNRRYRALLPTPFFIKITHTSRFFAPDDVYFFQGPSDFYGRTTTSLKYGDANSLDFLSIDYSYMLYIANITQDMMKNQGILPGCTS